VRAYLAVLMVVAVLMAATAYYLLSSSPPRTNLTLVIPPFTAEYMATYALETGIVSSSNLTITVQHTLQFNEILMDLQADIGFMSTEAFAKAYEMERPLKILGTAVVQGNEEGNALLFVRLDSEITDPSELKGRRIGVPTPRGLKSSNLILLDVLERRFNLSLSLESDLIIDKPLPQLPALLDAGEVDAVLVIGDVAAQMSLSPDKYRLICDVSEEFRRLYGEYPVVAVLVVKADLLEENPDLVREALRLLNESLSYSLIHRDEALEWALTQREGVELEAAQKSLEQYCIRYGLTEDDKMVIGKLFELAYSRGLISVLPDPLEVFVSLEP